MAKRISHLGIAVKDLASSEALFAKLLGDEHVHHEEVGVGRDHVEAKRGEVARGLLAKLERDPLHPAGALGHDPLAHRGRAREGDLAHVLVTDQRLAR